MNTHEKTDALQAAMLKNIADFEANRISLGLLASNLDILISNATMPKIEKKILEKLWGGLEDTSALMADECRTEMRAEEHKVVTAILDQLKSQIMISIS